MNRTLLPGPRTGAVRIPASKSQAHRMLICAALSRTPGHLIDVYKRQVRAFDGERMKRRKFSQANGDVCGQQR